MIDAAKAVAIPADQKILHVLPQEFIIDGQEGIRDPIGMSGVRLEAKVHIVTGADSAAQNIEKCIQRCGLEVDDIVLEQLASSFAVLTEDEKELGVCLVDIGGGTTDLAVFSQRRDPPHGRDPDRRRPGDQRHRACRCARRRSTPRTSRSRYACALSQLANPDESIEVPSVGDRPPRRLARQTLAEVVEPRYEEMFGLVREELRRCGFEEMIARRHRAHRRQRQDGRRDRARRRSVPHAGAPRHAAARRRPRPTWCAIRSIRPASGCCCTRATTRMRRQATRRVAARQREDGVSSA